MLKSVFGKKVFPAPWIYLFSIIFIYLIIRNKIVQFVQANFKNVSKKI